MVRSRMHASDAGLAGVVVSDGPASIDTGAPAADVPPPEAAVEAVVSPGERDAPPPEPAAVCSAEPFAAPDALELPAVVPEERAVADAVEPPAQEPAASIVHEAFACSHEDGPAQSAEGEAPVVVTPPPAAEDGAEDSKEERD